MSNFEKDNISLASQEQKQYEEFVVDHAHDAEFNNEGGLVEPTSEDWINLREIADDIPKSAYLIILVEFCERFTYYGLTGPFQNYIQNPLPPSCKFLVPNRIH